MISNNGTLPWLYITYYHLVANRDCVYIPEAIFEKYIAFVTR